MKIKKIIQDFKGLSEKMTEILDKETLYLTQKRVADFSSLQAEKLALVNFYEKQSAEMMTLLKSTEDISPEEMNTLQDTVLSLRKSMTQNSTALKAMNESNNRLIKTLIDSINKENQQVNRYGRSGTPLSSPQNKPTTGLIRQTQSG